MLLVVTTLVASAFCLLHVHLALAVIKLRHKHHVSMGHGDHEDLHRSIRAQGNLTEYAPITLILLACLELNGAPMVLTALLGAAAIAGRVLHAHGMLQPPEAPIKSRVLGMKFTLWTMIILALANVFWLAWNFIY